MSQLNGAYYGPSIPPPPKAYRRPSRDGGCCCCGGILRCCCGCIFDLIFSIICKLIVTVLVIVAIVGVIFWLIVRPNVVKVHVTDATLTQFNFTNSTNTLHYNLVLNITVRNPNKRVGIYYDYIEASALYHDAVFANQTLKPFFQHKKNTTALEAVFKGQEVVLLGSDKASKVDEEKGSGVFGIDLKFDMKVRFKLGLFKTGKVKPKVRCQLEVPLRSSPPHNGTSSTVAEFHDTACGWGYRWLWFHPIRPDPTRPE